MKKIFIIFAFTIFAQLATAQMDEKFYHPDKECIDIHSVNYEDVFLPIDEDTIHSIVIKPDNPVKATIIYFHGNGGNISKWIEHVRPLTDDGFQVCMIDYRGYGKSTGKSTHLNIAKDAQIFFDKMIERKDVKDTKLIIYGASIGTQIATHLARNNNDKISALILDGMMASFTDVALATSPAEYHEQIKMFVTSPYSAKEDITHLTDIELLFIHSPSDFIPIENAKAVHESASCPKTFWTYEGKHLEASQKHKATFLSYINGLLN